MLVNRVQGSLGRSDLVSIILVLPTQFPGHEAKVVIVDLRNNRATAADNRRGSCCGQSIIVEFTRTSKSKITRTRSVHGSYGKEKGETKVGAKAMEQDNKGPHQKKFSINFSCTADGRKVTPEEQNHQESGQTACS